MPYLVRYYKSRRGEFPVRDFIDKQNHETIAKYSRLYVLLTEYGPGLTFPHVKHISGRLYELRVRGKTEIRIFYARLNTIYVLLHAFQKKSRKVPEKELQIAKKRLTEVYHI